jgi:hypothetical protein
MIETPRTALRPDAAELADIFHVAMLLSFVGGFACGAVIALVVVSTGVVLK